MPFVLKKNQFHSFCTLCCSMVTISLVSTGCCWLCSAPFPPCQTNSSHYYWVFFSKSNLAALGVHHFLILHQSEEALWSTRLLLPLPPSVCRTGIEWWTAICVGCSSHWSAISWIGFVFPQLQSYSGALFWNLYYSNSASPSFVKTNKQLPSLAVQ